MSFLLFGRVRKPCEDCLEQPEGVFQCTLNCSNREILVSAAIPAGEVQFRDARGEVIGRIVNSSPPRAVAVGKSRLVDSRLSVPMPPGAVAPKGSAPDARLIHAVVALCDQFVVCGLEPPVAIMVAAGQVDMIQAVVAKSPSLLFDDTRCGELRIWGVPIREETQEGGKVG